MEPAPLEQGALHEVTGGKNMTARRRVGLEERLRDPRAKLKNDVDLWVATSGSPGGVHLVPLSYLWDGTAFLISTPRASVTGRNLLRTARCRLSLGPTCDVVVVDGAAEPVDSPTSRPRRVTRSRPRPVSTRARSTTYQYFLIRPGASRPGGRRTSCGARPHARRPLARLPAAREPTRSTRRAVQLRTWTSSGNSSLGSNRADAAQTAPAPIFVGRST